MAEMHYRSERRLPRNEIETLMPHQPQRTIKDVEVWLNRLSSYQFDSVPSHPVVGFKIVHLLPE